MLSTFLKGIKSINFIINRLSDVQAVHFELVYMNWAYRSIPYTWIQNLVVLIEAINEICDNTSKFVSVRYEWFSRRESVHFIQILWNPRQIQIISNVWWQLEFFPEKSSPLVIVIQCSTINVTKRIEWSVEYVDSEWSNLKNVSRRNVYICTFMVCIFAREKRNRLNRFKLIRRRSKPYMSMDASIAIKGNNVDNF